MFFKKKNDNNIDNNDKNAIDIESAESNNNNNKKEKRKFKDSINKKYLKNGSYSSVMIVVFVAIIIVINMIVGNLPSKYTQLDISSEKLYTIGDETKAMLKDLDKDVTIYPVSYTHLFLRKRRLELPSWQIPLRVCFSVGKFLLTMRFILQMPVTKRHWKRQKRVLQW